MDEKASGKSVDKSLENEWFIGWLITKKHDLRVNKLACFLREYLTANNNNKKTCCRKDNNECVE